MTPLTLGRTVRKAARDSQVRPVREAKIATAPDARGRCYVTCRSLTGDGRRLGPFYVAAHAEMDGGDVVLRVPARRDPCWLLLDQAGDPACVAAWEPA